MSINEQLSKLETEVAEHRGKVNEFIVNTVGYRKDLCTKLDKLMTTITQLPCSERKGWYISMNKQVTFMWFVLGGLLLAVLGVGINGVFEKDEMKKTLAMLKTNSIAEASQSVRQNEYNQRNDVAKR